jgi:hypothetical protein
MYHSHGRPVAQLRRNVQPGDSVAVVNLKGLVLRELIIDDTTNSEETGVIITHETKYPLVKVKLIWVDERWQVDGMTYPHLLSYRARMDRASGLLTGWYE